MVTAAVINSSLLFFIFVYLLADNFLPLQILRMNGYTDIIVDLFPTQTNNALHMGAAGEEVGGHGVLQPIATLLQQRHIPGQGGRVAGDVDDSSGCHFGQGFDGVGVQALPGRVNHHHIGDDALLFQFQSRLACVAAEKFRVFDAVSPGIFLGIQHCLLHHLHADDLAGGFCHAQRDGAHTAVQVQHQVIFGNLRLGNGGFVEPLGLVVVHLVERPGRQAEGKTAEGIFDVTWAVEDFVFIP